MFHQSEKDFPQTKMKLWLSHLFPMQPFSTPMVFWCFQGVEKRCTGNKWVKKLISWSYIESSSVNRRILIANIAKVLRKFFKRQNSCSQIIFKIVILKDFSKFIRKHMCSGLFFITLQSCWSAIVLKRDSGAGVFLWILRIF